MTGSEFLERAKELRPESVRIMLSGYTDLQSVTDAINRGAIYRFLTKPWDDELLRGNIRQAFEQYELRAERDRLATELLALNAQLAESNQGLQQRIACQGKEHDQHLRLMELSREVLEHLPVGILGIDGEGRIAIANPMACRLLGALSDVLVGEPADHVLPAGLRDMYGLAGHGDAIGKHHVNAFDAEQPLTVHAKRVGDRSSCLGGVLVLVPEPGSQPSSPSGDVYD